MCSSAQAKKPSGTVGAPSAWTEFGPPERMTALGLAAEMRSWCVFLLLVFFCFFGGVERSRLRLRFFCFFVCFFFPTAAAAAAAARRWGHSAAIVDGASLSGPNSLDSGVLRVKLSRLAALSTTESQSNAVGTDEREKSDATAIGIEKTFEGRPLLKSRTISASPGSSIEYTPFSLILRAISCVYCEP